MPETDEKPRGALFHWVANMFFAGIALFGGMLFGLEVPRDRVVLIVVLGALILIPITRRWERTAISKRHVQTAEPLGNGKSEESGPAT
ncbi:MAG TPA: hypothetical protein VHJ78_04295 [Actinomycetota bacterium]|nr:hypothetical protein [Actinomycetota bacterium]